MNIRTFLLMFFISIGSVTAISFLASQPPEPTSLKFDPVTFDPGEEIKFATSFEYSPGAEKIKEVGFWFALSGENPVVDNRGESVHGVIFLESKGYRYYGLRYSALTGESEWKVPVNGLDQKSGKCIFIFPNSEIVNDCNSDEKGIARWRVIDVEYEEDRLDVTWEIVFEDFFEGQSMDGYLYVTAEDDGKTISSGWKKKLSWEVGTGITGGCGECQYTENVDCGSGCTGVRTVNGVCKEGTSVGDGTCGFNKNCEWMGGCTFSDDCSECEECGISVRCAYASGQCTEVTVENTCDDEKCIELAIFKGSEVQPYVDPDDPTSGCFVGNGEGEKQTFCFEKGTHTIRECCNFLQDIFGECGRCQVDIYEPPYGSGINCGSCDSADRECIASGRIVGRVEEEPRDSMVYWDTRDHECGDYSFDTNMMVRIQNGETSWDCNPGPYFKTNYFELSPDPSENTQTIELNPPDGFRCTGWVVDYPGDETKHREGEDTCVADNIEIVAGEWGTHLWFFIERVEEEIEPINCNRLDTYLAYDPVFGDLPVAEVSSFPSHRIDKIRIYEREEGKPSMTHVVTLPSSEGTVHWELPPPGRYQILANVYSNDGLICDWEGNLRLQPWSDPIGSCNGCSDVLVIEATPPTTTPTTTLTTLISTTTPTTTTTSTTTSLPPTTTIPTTTTLRNWEIYRAGTAVEECCPPPDLFDLSCSPLSDEKNPAWGSVPSEAFQIVYESDMNENWNLLKNLYSQGNPNRPYTLQLTVDQSHDREASYSPDGEQVVFASNRAGNWEIYWVWSHASLELPKPFRVTRSFGNEREPSWSPENNKIVFASDKDGNWEIYITDVNGGSTRKVTYTPDIDEREPSYSPDGEWIAFSAKSNIDENDSWEIFKVRWQGGRPIQLTDNSYNDKHPTWSPDGEWIAFQSDRDDPNPNEFGCRDFTEYVNCDWNIYKMDSSLGGNQRKLTNNPASDIQPIWSEIPPGDVNIAFASNRDPSKICQPTEGRSVIESIFNFLRNLFSGVSGSFFKRI